MKEIDIQNKLWGTVLQEQGIQKKIDSAKNGWIPRMRTLSELPDCTKEMLGDFAPRVLGLSMPSNPQSLLPEQLAIAGGWCALRTKDVQMLSNGVLMNPLTNGIEPINSVDQVNTWIRDSIAFDQIVESIGAANAREYLGISERRLWSTRIVEKLGVVFKKSLTPTEADSIEQAIEEAELRRAVMTERYLAFVTGNRELTLTRVVDDDIWDDLGRARDILLKTANLNLTDLQNGNPQAINGRSRVWAMYTQPYFDVLRDAGYLSTRTVFIAEPVQHAAVESLADKAIADRFFRADGRGIFFDPSGINADTGFLAFIECINKDKQKTKEEVPVGFVPNISNWRELFKPGQMFAVEENIKINPTDNPLFIWGLNLLPFATTQEALLALVAIQERFKAEKERLSTQFSPRDPEQRIGLQAKIAGLRKEMENEIIIQNAVIATNLYTLFSYLTA